jgi:serine/threonine protein kinase
MSIDLKQSSYIELRSIIKERTSSVIFWVGSGISAFEGMPSWDGLKKNLIRALDSKIKISDDNRKKILLKKKNSILKLNNNWICFERLCKALGKTTYRSTIKRRLNTKDPSSNIYQKIWNLEISGMINSNIDKLALVGHNNAFKNTAVINFVGKSIKSYLHVLNNPNKFLLNIHGDYEDVNSWVFTYSELKELMESKAYNDFIKASILSKTIVFLGISADDVSSGGHIAKLSKQGYVLNTHYWITDRCDTKTDKWAEESGIQLIKYNTDGDHKEIYEIIDDLSAYIPQDETAPVVYSNQKDAGDTLPEPNELQREEAELIRLFLNKEAVRIFKSNKDNPYEEFAKFTLKYDEAIHRSWYTTVHEPNNEILGFKLTKEVSHNGLFGQVYKALDKDGEFCAIKILHNQVRKREEYIQGFRRGIKSMKILNNSDIEGMVKLLDASEIPALIVMEWVDGINLYDAVTKGKVNDSNRFLEVVLKLSEIVNRAHRLPERVLHRDIRPTNIMIKWKDDELDFSEIIVLDFDLAWYKSSIESKEIDFKISNGYLAPEQISNIKKVSTRSAAVDSFGLGMTMFFILNKDDPLPSQQKHDDWQKAIFRVSSNFFRSCKWKSAGKRIARLIINCTKQNQHERWDFSQILSELKRLKIAIESPNKIKSTDLIVEEIIFRSSYKESYEWDEDNLKATIIPISNEKIELLSDESNRSINILIQWTNPTSSTRKKLSKHIHQAAENIINLLLKNNWKLIQNDKDNNQIVIKAQLKIKLIRGDYNKYASSISDIYNMLYIH